MSKTEKTLLVIAPGLHDGVYDHPYYLIVAETGECLASYFCSGAGYAWRDLYADRPERIEKWKERFGEFEVEYIDKTEITREALQEKNKKFYEDANNASNTKL